MSAPLTRTDLAEPSGPSDSPFARLFRLLTALNAATVDYDDPDAEAAYYAQAQPVIDAIIQAPARTLDELRIKAEAYAWAVGGSPDLNIGTTSEQIAASIVRDLLRP